MYPFTPPPVWRRGPVLLSFRLESGTLVPYSACLFATCMPVKGWCCPSPPTMHMYRPLCPGLLVPHVSFLYLRPLDSQWAATNFLSNPFLCLWCSLCLPRTLVVATVLLLCCLWFLRVILCLVCLLSILLKLLLKVQFLIFSPLPWGTWKMTSCFTLFQWDSFLSGFLFLVSWWQPLLPQNFSASSILA